MALERAGPIGLRRRHDHLRDASSPDVGTSPARGACSATSSGSPACPPSTSATSAPGFLYGLSVADAWVRVGAYQNVLVVGAEVHSTGIELNERGRDVAVLFGDGAGRRPHRREPRRHDAACSRSSSTPTARARRISGSLRPVERARPARITHEMLDRGDTVPADERQAGLPLGHREDARGRARGPRCKAGARRR